MVAPFDQTEPWLPPLALAKGGLSCPGHGLLRAQTHMYMHAVTLSLTHARTPNPSQA